MADISNIVSVTTSVNSASVKQEGFGTLLVAGYHQLYSDRVRFYSSLSGLVSDGFTSAHPVYKAVAAGFAQSPQPTKIAVGRMGTAETVTYTVTPSAANSTLYRVSVNGQLASFTSDASATVAEICAGLQAAIAALSISGVTATDNTTNVGIAGTAGTALWVSTPSLSLLAVEQTNSLANVASDLDAIKLENNDWYGLSLTSQSDAAISAAAGWAESNKKLHFASTASALVLTNSGSDIASTLETAAYDRTALIWSTEPMQYASAAFACSGLPLKPGKVTWKFRKPKGITAAELTETQIANLQGKNCNFLTSYSGLAMTAEGVSSSGEFIDVTRDTDWHDSRLKLRILTVLANADKTPFTDGGIEAIAAEVRAQLQESIEAGFLAESPAPVVSVPKAANVSAPDKAARILRDITYTATLAGAIHKVELNGTVSL